MGREKEHHQRLKYQIASARKKTLENQLSVELSTELGMSETKARLLAHRMSQWILCQPGVRGPNQVLMEAAAGRTSFVRSGRRATRKVRLTPFDTEDLDLELSFGLAVMQRGRFPADRGGLPAGRPLEF